MMKRDDDSSTGTITDPNDRTKNIPNELLVKIFTTVTVASEWQDLWTLPSPVILSSVCSRWRTVAQNTPELWVNIIVPLHKSNEDCIRWTTEWIARSGTLLISVIIDDAMADGGVVPDFDAIPDFDDTKAEVVEPDLIIVIMDLLQQHSERLRRLALHTKHSAMMESTLSPLRSAPNLQQLTINSDDNSASWFGEVENDGKRQFLSGFPRLTILKAQGSMVPSISNLTSLTVGGLSASYNDMSQYLTASPGLQHLSLHWLMPLGDPPPNAALIRADSLRSLAVSLLWDCPPPGEGSTYIFKYLAMPNIKCLELEGDAWKASDFGKSLSSAKLDTLRISKRSEHSFEDNTINFLRSFSTVRHLQLVDASTKDLLLKPSGDKPAWPELQTITLDTSTADDVLNLCDFVTSHKQLQVVGLSTSARTHLSSSLRREDDKMVEIRTLRSPKVGPLDPVEVVDDAGLLFSRLSRLQI